MTREEIALRIFTAYMARDGRLALYPELGENEIRVAFTLADTFLKVAEKLPPVEVVAER